MDPNTKLLLDKIQKTKEELNRRFDDQDTKWERRFADWESGRSTRDAAIDQRLAAIERVPPASNSASPPSSRSASTRSAPSKTSASRHSRLRSRGPKPWWRTSGSKSPSCLRRPTMGCSTQCLPASASRLHLRRRPRTCLPGSTSTGPRGTALHRLHGIVAMGLSRPCIISRPMVSLRILLLPTLSLCFPRHHRCPLIHLLPPLGRRRSALKCFPTIALHQTLHLRTPTYLTRLILRRRRLFHPNLAHLNSTLLTPVAFPNSTFLVSMVTILVCGVHVLRSISPCTQCPNPCGFPWLKCISMVLPHSGFNPLSRRFRTVPGWTSVV